MADSGKTEIELPGIDNWSLFKFERGGGPAVVAVNDDMRAFKNRYYFPWQLTVSIEALSLAKTGLPDEAEGTVLNTHGREIERIVLTDATEEGAPNAIYLARSTWSTVRELVFRLHAPESANALLEAASKRKDWQRAWSYVIEPDIDWEQAEKYLSLYSKR